MLPQKGEKNCDTVRGKPKTYCYVQKRGMNYMAVKKKEEGSLYRETRNLLVWKKKGE